MHLARLLKNVNIPLIRATFNNSQATESVYALNSINLKYSVYNL
jgi:hypothetical protein